MQSIMLHSFGKMENDFLLALVDGYSVSESDMNSVEKWFCENISDRCVWGVGSVLPSLIPHVYDRSGEDFFGWLSILGWMERHSGFTTVISRPLGFYADVDMFLKALSPLAWREAYPVVVLLVTATGERVFAGNADLYCGWFDVALSVYREGGLDRLSSHIGLVLQGISATVINQVAVSGVDDELLRAAQSVL